MVLHFPIALVAVAAMMIVWSFMRRPREGESRPISPALWLVGIAALSAIATSATGWVFAGGEYADTKGTLNLHRWLGVSSAVIVLVAYIVGAVAHKVSSSRANRIYIALVFIAAPLVGFTGHIGGGLVHGKDFVIKPLLRSKNVEKQSEPESDPTPLDQKVLEEITKPEADPQNDPPLLSGPTVDLEEPAAPIPLLSVSFETNVFPILENSCIRCHNPDKSRGRVRLDDLEHALQVVEPGNPDESLIVNMIELPENDEDLMPQDGPPLADEEIAIIRAWIASLQPE